MARLFTPGPVEPYEEVLEALRKPLVSHRSEEFRGVLLSILDKISKISDLDGEVAILSGSGTLATEAMIYSTIKPGERVLVISYGEFGERLAETSARRGASVNIYRLKPGEPLDLGYVEETIRRSNIAWVLTTHVETSYGHRLYELEDLARLSRGLGAPLLLDAVSSLGGERLSISRWGLGGIASCSQKALGSLPGLSLVAIDRELLKRTEMISRVSPPPRYLDLWLYIENARKGYTPFTPAINLFYALERALARVLEIGVERYVEIHREKAEALYRSIDSDLIRPLIGSRSHRSNTVAAFTLDRGLRSSDVVKEMAREGYIVATGHGDGWDRIIRIGTMGNISADELRSLAKKLIEIASRKAGI